MPGTGGGAGRGSGGSGSGGQSAGGASGTVAAGFCPPGPYETLNLSNVTAMKIAGAPPSDAFNNMGNDFTILEGPVWVGSVLYFSEIKSGMAPPPARILQLTMAGQVSEAIATAGTNGLALDRNGRLIGANHTRGEIVRFGSMTGDGSPMALASTYDGKRFNSPNDLTVRADGTIYFTDPDWQAPTPRPQTAPRVYRLPPGSTTPTPATMETLQNPNGVTLSLDETALFVSTMQALKRFPVMPDGTLGAGADFGNQFGSDGMAIDCAGNLYVTANAEVAVLSSANGTRIGTIPVSGAQAVTNVAFGGPQRRTLFITGMGSGQQRGVFRAELNVPGLPY